VRAQQDGSDYTFTGEVVGFDDGVYIVREGDIVRVKREVSPHNVLDVVSHDPDVRDAERQAELLEDEVRTLQARCAELEEDLRRTKLDAYQVALERDTLRECVDALAAEAVPVAVPREVVEEFALVLRGGGAAVPVAELRALTERWEVEPHHTLGGYLLSGIRDLCAAAEQRVAAAKPAEGGEP
jgi:hypothetical protein